jgi:2-hydroxychromene-2-carboxylate isomerase
MPALKSAVSRTVTRLITSPALRSASRNRHALLRSLRGGAAQVHYFHQADDPYSHLAALQLEALTKRYRVVLVAHLVPPPDAAAAPDSVRLQQWSARDAQRLAAHYGLSVPDFSKPFDSLHMDRTSFLAHALGANAAAPGDDALARGQALRATWGHYLGATFYFEGEWYWGTDRLHYLEQRLREGGLAQTAERCELVAPQTLLWRDVPKASPVAAPPALHFYCSLRSPYTYLAVSQVQQLVRHYGVALQIRFVLPMVMRGLPVPLAKRLYITRDTKREAERLGLPFGCIVDPVGTPTERGLALLHRAIAMGRGVEMAHSFLQGVFADGVDAGSDSGLLRLSLRAGLSATDMHAALADESWRAVADANRAEMLSRGMWGVPSFRVDDMPSVWGQDRLWMVEQDLIHALTATAKPLEFNHD